jgi:hypothetical protein
MIFENGMLLQHRTSKEVVRLSNMICVGSTALCNLTSIKNNKIYDLVDIVYVSYAYKPIANSIGFILGDNLEDTNGISK